MASRAPRETETRVTEKRPAPWEPASAFIMPPNGDGKVYRWIRAAINGEPDRKNWNKRSREGWVPLPCSEMPEMAEGRDEGRRLTDSIEIDGMLLCWLPVEKARARRSRQDAFNQQQIRSVNNSMFQLQDYRMPWEKPVMRSWVTTGGGKAPREGESSKPMGHY